MLNKIFCRALYILLIGTVGSVSAQDAPIIRDYIVILHDNHLWRLDATSEALDRFSEPLPTIRGITMSPVGDYAVYKADPEALADEIAAECPCGGGELPSDLTLVDLRDGTRERIADQPTADDLFAGIARSIPVWSPDGRYIAWTEGVDPSALVIYDREQRTSARVAEGLQTQSRVPLPVTLTSWTAAGILVETVDFDTDRSGFRLYRADGQIAFELAPQFASTEQFFMLLDGAQELLAVKAGAWRFFDVTTGAEISLSTGRFAEAAPLNPSASYRIPVPTLQPGTPQKSYDILAANGERLDRWGNDETVYLLPSGDSVVIPFANRLTIWRASARSTITLPLPEEPMVMLRPQPMMVRVPNDSPLVTRGTCANSGQDFRLSVYYQGYVLGDTPNNVRTEPRVSGALVGQIAVGDWFTVLEGPICTSDGIAWWRVSGDNIEGWTAESAPNIYFLQPGCPPSGCARG